MQSWYILTRFQITQNPVIFFGSLFFEVLSSLQLNFLSFINLKVYKNRFNETCDHHGLPENKRHKKPLLFLLIFSRQAKMFLNEAYCCCSRKWILNWSEKRKCYFEKFVISVTRYLRLVYFSKIVFIERVLVDAW